MESSLFAHPPDVPLYLPERLRGFFILPEDIPYYVEQGYYNFGLVILSYIIVSISAYVALDIASKLPQSTDRSLRIKIICGALAMGAGIWSMHFIGMLAYEMRMLVTYDPWITAVSMLVAVLFAGAAFKVISGEHLTLWAVSIAAPLLGLAICGMHYIGMQAMQMDAKLLYRPDLFLLSFIIASSASAAALTMMFHARESRHPTLSKVCAAMVMGIAVCGMHYTGMAASVFLPYANCRYATDQDFSGLAASVTLITFLIILIAYLIKQLDEAMAEAQQRAAQLIQVQKMEAVGQLTGGIAHDFNNILGVIIGNLELLLRMPSLPPRAELFIKTGLQSAMKASDLVHRLLAFSRKQVLQPVPTDLAALIPSTLILVEHAVGSQVTVKTQIADNLPLVRIDPVHLESAILNLALNARDAMPGGGELVIKIGKAVLSQDQASEMQLPTGEYIAVSVQDNGSGMTQDILSKAMEPFFTTKETGKGSGMGLSMVFGFARQSGGNVMLESKPHAGTKVTIYLPVTHESVKADLPQNENKQKLFNNENILVVDDEDDLLRFIQISLQDMDCNVQTASSGEEALGRLKELKFDLIITDVLMPGVNGYRLAEQAQKLQPGIKVLFISGYAQQSTLPSFLSPDRCHFLAKPFTLNALIKAIEKILSQNENILEKKVS